ncbi:MAG: rhodanese-like domain-containing protein [Bacteroidetes bacterium]|nr:rhodanese-like domain-containing protein [Bacteroidota bacterium]
MKAILILLLTSMVFCNNLSAQQLDPPPALVDYSSFVTLTYEVEDYREARMVGVDKFIELANTSGVYILDTRSKEMFDQKHIKGAVHLNFSDFTADKLAKLFPSRNVTILIYCNNNFSGDPYYFALKSLPLALNIPTFINLYGYGYRDIYELSSLVPVDGGGLEFEGLAVE